MVFIVQRFFALGVDFGVLVTKETLPGLLFVSVCTMLTFFLASCGWTALLSYFAGKKIPLIPTYGLYVRANLAKYLPGNVAHYAMRQVYGASCGIRQRDMLVSSVLEIGCMAIGAFTISFILAKDILLDYFQNNLSSSWILPVVIAVIAGVIIAGMFFMRKKGFSIKEILPYFHRRGIYLAIAVVIGITACNMFIYGGNLLFLFSSYSAAGGNAVLIISAGIVSWFVGFVTPGVPGGIGVREAVLLLMLSPILPDGVVLFAAVLQRLAFILSDIFSWIIGKIIEGKTAGAGEAVASAEGGE